MYLFENQLSGTIPTTFNQLVEMTIFRVESNGLIGTMPLQRCDLEQLSADCIEEVTCAAGCCTSCCIDGGSCVAVTDPPTSGPTSAGTEEASPPVLSPAAPTSPPVAPTLSPTIESTGAATVLVTEDITSISTTTPSDTVSSCSASIWTDRECYEEGDNIVITFENCESTQFDWIGIFSTATNIMELGDPLAWVWACGDQFCNEVVDAGQAILFNARGTGSFVVYLLRSDEDSDGSLLAYGVGNSFEMSTNCN